MNDRAGARPVARLAARLIAVAVILGVLALAVVRIGVPGRLRWFGAGPQSSPPVARVVPEGTRIKVELLNATDTRSLARTAAAVMRDAGFDVVYFGNTAERQDSTVVRDRSNHPDWATLAAGVLGPARTEVRADSGRLIDLTVLVGRRWRPPAEPFRP